jgi:eukaryotic-like serine/threonine-protein kinase
MSNRGDGHDSPRRAGIGSSPGSGDRDSGGVPAQGEVIDGKYRVDGMLGMGGMGVVVSARHIQLGQRVAIKFMRSTGGDAASVERFFREARAVVALSSEHVAKVLDMGTLEAGSPYIVMEFLAGIDLAESLKRHGPMPIAMAVESVLQACEAIAEAHSVGIVHRDLKPSNLFATMQLDGASFVKVLDFGISKMAPAGGLAHDLTVSGAIMGSPAYMSPEQVRNSKNIDARSDIWAIGVILYELLSGVSPFRGDTLGEVFSRIVSESPVPIQRLRPEVPAALVAAIGKCLERDPALRFSNLGELASVLLPLAPAEAAVSVRRILRVCGGVARPPPPSSGTLAAPESSSAESASFDHVETGPPWLRSNATPERSVHRSRSIVAVVAVGVVALIGAGLYLARRSPSGAASSDVGNQATSHAIAASPVPLPPTAPPASSQSVSLTPEPAPVAAAAVDTGPREVAADHEPPPTPVPSSPSSGPPPRRPRPVRVQPVVPPAPRPLAPAPSVAPRPPIPAATPTPPQETDVF